MSRPRGLKNLQPSSTQLEHGEVADDVVHNTSTRIDDHDANTVNEPIISHHETRNEIHR